MQPRIAGVDHQAAAGHREVGLEVAMVVPREGSDGIAWAQAELSERAGESSRSPGALGIGVPEQRSVRLARDDLHVAELRGGMLDDA